MFRFFPKDAALEIFNKTSHEDQARLAQVNKQFNEILKDKSSELEKYKSGCTVHSVGHTHVVLQKANPFSFAFHAMKGNKKVFECGMGWSLAAEFKMAMEEDTSFLIKKLESSPITKKAQLLLQEALEEENRSTFKNRK